jgi:hypothetical protein
MARRLRVEDIIHIYWGEAKALILLDLTDGVVRFGALRRFLK